MSRAGIRAQRSNAGTVTPTDRDREVLRFIGDHGGLRYDLLALVLGRHDAAQRSPRAAYTWRARMERLGLVRRLQVRGVLWLVLTRPGMREAGVPWELPGAPTDLLAQHTTTATLLRLWLERRHPGSEWVSERTYRSEQRTTGARFRAPDGALRIPGRGLAGVEVELNLKRVREYRQIIAEQHPSLDAVWWFTLSPESLQGRLALCDGPARPVHTVHRLPPEVWPPIPIGGRWRL
jgi:hypothetical protein